MLDGERVYRLVLKSLHNYILTRKTRTVFIKTRVLWNHIVSLYGVGLPYQRIARALDRLSNVKMMIVYPDDRIKTVNAYLEVFSRSKHEKSILYIATQELIDLARKYDPDTFTELLLPFLLPAQTKGPIVRIMSIETKTKITELWEAPAI